MKKQLPFVLCIFLLHSLSYGQGKIDEAEESLKKTDRIDNKGSKETTYTNSINDTENNILIDVIGGIFIQLFTYTAYSIAIESPFEMKHKGHSAFLTKYPYQNSNAGNYTYNWHEDTKIFTTSITNRFLIETNTMYGSHFNIDMQFLKRMGITFSYLQLWEENSNFGNNSLAIYTALAKYNRVRTERFNASWGLGAAYVDGDVNSFGFTYGIGAELFLVKPVSLEANFNQILINNNSINTFNALLNYHKKQFKFILGYEHLKVGVVSFSNFTTGFGLFL